MKYIFILLFLTTCWNDIDKTYCFECISKNDTIIYCDYTKSEIEELIQSRIDYLNDTLTCKKQ